MCKRKRQKKREEKMKRQHEKNMTTMMFTHVYVYNINLHPFQFDPLGGNFFNLILFFFWEFTQNECVSNIFNYAHFKFLSLKKSLKNMFA